MYGLDGVTCEEAQPPSHNESKEGGSISLVIIIDLVVKPVSGQLNCQLSGNGRVHFQVSGQTSVQTSDRVSE